MSRLVAIVDDEDVVRKAIERLLRAARLHTAGFATCEHFLDSLARRQPDCLILDLHLPGMSGIELLYELQRRRLTLPTIVVTAHDDPETRRLCLDAGVMSFLPKPIDSTVLLPAIVRALTGESPTAP